MDDLRELVDRWRHRADTFHENGHMADAHAHRLCANELEGTLDDLEERNVSDDLAMDPEHFAALVAEELPEKRTNARVITEPRDGDSI